MATSRAVWFSAPRTAELREEEVGEPGPHEVRVRSTLSLISAGTEMLVYRGEAVPGSPLNVMSRGDYAFPIKYGYQVVGVVEAAGEEARLPVGQRVFVRHPHQDRFVISDDETLVRSLPESVSDRQAAFANLMEVALTAVLDAPVRHGDVVTVYGMGIIGLLVAQLARRTAGQLVCVDRLAMRRDLAIRLGADAAVDPADAAKAVMEASAGRGADISFEVSGSPQALQSAIELTGQEGTVDVVSYYGSRDVHLRLAPEFHWRRHRIVSSHTAVVGSGLQPRWDTLRRQALAFSLLPSMHVEAMITESVPFARAPEMYERVDQSPESILGALLEYGP